MNFTSIVNQLAKNGKIVSQVQAQLQPVIAKATGTAATILPQSAVRLKEGIDVLNAGKTVVTAIVNDVAAGHSISALAKTTADFDTNWDKFAKEVEDVFNATSLQGQGKVLETFAKTEFGPNVFYAGSAIKNEVPNILGGISDFQSAVNGFGGSYRDPVAAAKKIKNGVDGIVNATERVANSLNQMVKIYKGQGNPGNIAGYPLLNQIGNLHNNKFLQLVENAMRIGGGVAAVGVGGMNVAADLKKGDFVQASKDAKQTFDNFKSLTKNNMGSGTTPKVQNAVPSSSTSTAPGTTASPFVSTVSQQNTPSTSQTPSASMGGISSSAPTPSPSAVATPSSSTLSSSLNSTSKASDASSASPVKASSPSSMDQSTSTTSNASDNKIGSSNRQQQDKNDKKDNHQDDDDDDEKRDDDDDDGGFANANSNSYVCSGARIKCSFGTSASQLVVYPDRTVFLTGKPMANISDHQSMYNIKPFGRCRTVAYPPTGSATAAHHGHLTPMPCVPGTYINWMMGKNDYIVKGNPALLKTSYCQCCYGGIITLINDGQNGEGTQWVTKNTKKDFKSDQDDKKKTAIDALLNSETKFKPQTKEEEDVYKQKAQIVLKNLSKLPPSQLFKIQKSLADLPNNLSNLEKLAIVENYYQIEKALGLQKGKRMSIEEADKQNANPQHTYRYVADPNGTLDIGGVKARLNPNYKEEFSINCATCSAAYALRLMGFDVKAKGNLPNTDNEWLSKSHSFDIWNNVDGTKATPIYVQDWMRENNINRMNGGNYKVFFEQNCKEQGVYIVTVKWKEKEIVNEKGQKELVSNGAHATVLQRDSDGKLYYIEPQVYQESKSVDGRRSIDDLIYNSDGELKLTSFPPSEKGVMRVDNKLFNSKYVSLFDT